MILALYFLPALHRAFSGTAVRRRQFRADLPQEELLRLRLQFKMGQATPTALHPGRTSEETPACAANSKAARIRDGVLAELDLNDLARTNSCICCTNIPSTVSSVSAKHMYFDQAAAVIRAC